MYAEPLSQRTQRAQRLVAIGLSIIKYLSMNFVSVLSAFLCARCENIVRRIPEPGPLHILENADISRTEL